MTPSAANSPLAPRSSPLDHKRAVAASTTSVLLDQLDRTQRARSAAAALHACAINAAHSVAPFARTRLPRKDSRLGRRLGPHRG
eukprot:4983758-Pleurochrysis_carterae.AAC.3